MELNSRRLIIVLILILEMVHGIQELRPIWIPHPSLDPHSPPGHGMYPPVPHHPLVHGQLFPLLPPKPYPLIQHQLYPGFAGHAFISTGNSNPHMQPVDHHYYGWGWGGPPHSKKPITTTEATTTVPPCYYLWVAASGGAIPPGSYEAGNENGIPCYICKALCSPTEEVPGVLVQGYNECSIECNGQQAFIPDYKVFTVMGSQSNFNWATGITGSNPPPNGIISGQTSTNQILYSCTCHGRTGNGSLGTQIGGNYQSSSATCYVSFPQSAVIYHCTTFDVLVNNCPY